MLTRTDVIDKVKLFTNELLQQGIPLDLVILFGSYSQNNQKEDSDIDVALVSDVFTGFGFEDRKNFSRINNKKEFIDIETKTYPTKYYYQSDPFIDEINKTGLVLYSSGSLHGNPVNKNNK